MKRDKAKGRLRYAVDGLQREAQRVSGLVVPLASDDAQSLATDLDMVADTLRRAADALCACKRGGVCSNSGEQSGGDAGG